MRLHHRLRRKTKLTPEVFIHHWNYLAIKNYMRCRYYPDIKCSFVVILFRYRRLSLYSGSPMTNTISCFFMLRENLTELRCDANYKFASSLPGSVLVAQHFTKHTEKPSFPPRHVSERTTLRSLRYWQYVSYQTTRHSSIHHQPRRQQRKSPTIAATSWL